MEQLQETNGPDGNAVTVCDGDTHVPNALQAAPLLCWQHGSRQTEHNNRANPEHIRLQAQQ
jgi:hypothetical protein